MSDIERLRVVATVARTHSMNEAAKVHGVAQSTVTRSVAAAESLVGFPLFQRGSAGAQLAVGAPAAITLIERIVTGFDELRALSGAGPASIRIAHRDGIVLPGMLDSAIVRWNRENTLRAETIVHDDPIEALRAGEVTFAVVWNSGDLVEGFETEVIRVVRGGRLDLLSPKAPSDRVRGFLKTLR